MPVKTKKTVFCLIAILMALLLLPAAAAGVEEEVVRNEDINLPAGKLEISRNTIVNGNVTVNLGELIVLGIINGDVNNNMGQVTIEGDVNGDVDANMGQVIIRGNVSGDVTSRIGEVIVEGSVGGNLAADLGEAKVAGSVGGDVGSGFGELIISGIVAGDVTSKAGSVIITGIVEGDVIVDQGLVELGPGAVVSGRVYVGRGQIVKAGTAVAGSVELGEDMKMSELAESRPSEGCESGGISDELTDTISRTVTESVNRAMREFRFMPHMTRTNFFDMPFFSFYGSVARSILNMLILFALTALTYSLFPRHSEKAKAALMAKPGPVFGWGALAAVLAIPLMIFLAITVIGIPLIFVEIIVLAAAAILGYTGIAGLVGERIIGMASQRTASPLGSIALGVLALGLVGMIPILGSLLALVIYIIAVGMALVTRFGSIDPEGNVPVTIEQQSEQG